MDGRLWALAPVLVIVVAAGCGGPQYGSGEAPPAEYADVELEADAYLFDAQVRRDGKPTSIRLEIYRTDSVIGLSGRGYLGKGALKGRLTQDSLIMYFPSSNEYVREPVERLLRADECPEVVPHVPLAALLTTLPDSLDEAGALVVEADYSDKGHPKFVIRAGDCPWWIEVSYDRHERQWEVEDFRFEDGGSTSLKANRREARHGLSLPYYRFVVEIPDDAVRVIP